VDKVSKINELRFNKKLLLTKLNSVENEWGRPEIIIIGDSLAKKLFSGITFNDYYKKTGVHVIVVSFEPFKYYSAINTPDIKIDSIKLPSNNKNIDLIFTSPKCNDYFLSKVIPSFKNIGNLSHVGYINLGLENLPDNALLKSKYFSIYK